MLRKFDLFLIFLQTLHKEIFIFMPRRSGFTHFGSIPFIGQAQKQSIKLIQEQIKAVLTYTGYGECVSASSANQFHMTLSMLKLSEEASEKAVKVLEQNRLKFKELMKDTILITGKINYFTERDGQNLDGPKYIRVIYLQVKQDEEFQKVLQVTDLIVKILLQNQVISAKSLNMMGIHYDTQTKMYKNKNPHITLFKCRNLHEDKKFTNIFKSHFENQFIGNKLMCHSVDISYRFKRDESRYFYPTWRCSYQ